MPDDFSKDLVHVLRRACAFVANVPTDDQLNARLKDGDTGRAIWIAMVRVLKTADRKGL